MKAVLGSILALLATPVQAQILLGTATVVDGDTLRLGGERIRLQGIDAPESQQTCNRHGETWACGREATALLAHFAEGKDVTCEQRALDAYGRLVATCAVEGHDLGSRIVEAGLAVALPQYSDAYVEAEARARKFGIGIWGSEFVAPSEYRAAHPAQFATPKPARVPPARSMVVRPPGQASGVYYVNCRQAWAMGAAPIYFGQPGYRPELDGDNDGIACEPYRGRR